LPVLSVWHSQEADWQCSPKRSEYLALHTIT
jgi:hypothetical protein